MPAKSRAQQEAMAIAEHSPGKLFKRNKGLLEMSKSQLHDFAATPTSDLPPKVGNAPGSHTGSTTPQGPLGTNPAQGLRRNLKRSGKGNPYKPGFTI